MLIRLINKIKTAKKIYKVFGFIFTFIIFIYTLFYVFKIGLLNINWSKIINPIEIVKNRIPKYDSENIYQNGNKVGQVVGKVNRGETIYYFYCLNSVSDEFNIEENFDYEGKKLNLIPEVKIDMRGYKNSSMLTDCGNISLMLSNHMMGISASIQ